MKAEKVFKTKIYEKCKLVVNIYKLCFYVLVGMKRGRRQETAGVH